MPSISLASDPYVQELNRVVAAHVKQKDGKRLSGADMRSIESFRDFYRQADQLDSPDLRQAYRQALTEQLGFLFQVENNTVLTQHLRGLVKKGHASNEDLAKIQSIAGKLSVAEDNAIGATLSYLALNGGLSEASLDSLDAYLGSERTNRARHVRNRRLVGILIGAGTLVGGFAAATLFGWAASGAMLAKSGAMGAAAAKNLQIGALVAGAFGGGALGAKLGHRIVKAASAYGVHD